jgi:hypothetical protein
MRNLIAQPLRSLNTIQLLVSANLKHLIVNVNSWHIAKMIRWSHAKAQSQNLNRHNNHFFKQELTEEQRIINDSVLSVTSCSILPFLICISLRLRAFA